MAKNDDIVTLRDVEPSDIADFYAHQIEPGAAEMAGMPTRDRPSFAAHWQRNLHNPINVTRTIVVGGAVAGYIASFVPNSEREVGYWIGQAYWGRGVATAALQQFVRAVEHRELMAHVVKHNAASMRVLRKCGFTLAGQNDEEYILLLPARR